MTGLIGHGTGDEPSGAGPGARRSHARRLAWALALTAVFCLVQVAGGLVFGSLALLSDAGHMLVDSLGLAVALVALRLGARAANDRCTFGHRRIEVVGAAINALLLMGTALVILLLAAGRLSGGQVVHAPGMLGVAVLGLAVNLVCWRLLAAGRNDGLNLKGAYLEVMADAVSSVGVVLAALLLMLTGWQWIDPLVAVAIALWMLPRGWRLLREAGDVLLERVPRHIDVDDVRNTLLATPGVVAHDQLRIWSAGAGTPACMVHVEVEGRSFEAVGAALELRLRERFGFGQVAVQVRRSRGSGAGARAAA